MPESFFSCLGVRAVRVFLVVLGVRAARSFLSSLVSVPLASFLSSLVSVPPGSFFGFFALAGSVGAVIAVRGGTAGTGIGNGDRAPGTTHQQARCEHANTCSEAQMRQNHHLAPPAKGPLVSSRRLSLSQDRFARSIGSKPSIQMISILQYK